MGYSCINIKIEYFVFGVAAVLSLILTGWLRAYAISHKMLDIPNARSSHSAATPRGGGVAVVVVMLIGLPLLWWINDFRLTDLAALCGAGVLVAVIGWLDDRGHVDAYVRLTVHFVAIGWALVWLDGLPPVTIFDHVVNIGWVGNICTAIYLVWLLNLYNFMDGIDGIAAIEAITVCFCIVIISMLTLTDNVISQIALLLAASVVGFLFWNFPRAKIFMGDAGSGFIGIMLGIFSVKSAWIDPDLLWAWVILLGVFMVDSTVTLLRRIFRGEQIFTAHRSHAYQYAARKHKSHIKVTVFVGMINIIWLFPNALIVIKGKVDGIVGLLIAYIPLIILAYTYKAGAKELQDV